MSTAHELIEELIQRSLAGNNSIIDLYADDGVHELPFSPTGEPVTITRPQMAERLAAASDAPPRFVDQHLRALTVYEPDPRTAIAEYAIDGRIAATDTPVTVTAIMLVTESGGQIERSRAYLNPSVLASIM
jgi:uncharacterized protein